MIQKYKLVSFTMGLVLLMFLAKPASGQISYGGTPPSFAYESMMQTKSQIMPFTTPIPNVEKLLAEDKINDDNGMPPTVAKILSVDIDFIKHAELIILPSSEEVYQFAIYEPDAIALTLFYSAFRIPEGGKLFIYNKDKTHVLGAYTDKTNPKNTSFATELVAGDYIILEYVAPSKNAEKPHIVIEGIGYGYNHLEVLSDTKSLQKYGSSGSCMVNINCAEGIPWQDAKRGVARYLYPTRSTGGVSACSGSVINNVKQDFKPYFLSAAHCFIPLDARDYGQIIAYFHFESPSCQYESTTDRITLPEGTKTMTGATVLANTELIDGSDGVLIMFNEPIPTSYNIYYNGWDRSEEMPTSGVSIHHPDADLKKISTFGEKKPSITTWPGDNKGRDNAHMLVFFDATQNGHSIILGGSSGSPIFNSEKLIVGTCTGTSFKDCVNPNLESYYARMSFHWDKFAVGKQMKTYLDPDATGAMKCQGAYQESVPNADFVASHQRIYASQSVTYNSVALAPEGSTYNWIFEGGTPSSYVGETPLPVKYNTPGIYDVELIVNEGTTKEVRNKRTDYITVVQKSKYCPEFVEVGTGTEVSQFPLGAASAQIISASLYKASELGNRKNIYIDEIAWDATNYTQARAIFVYVKEVSDNELTSKSYQDILGVEAQTMYASSTFNEFMSTNLGWTPIRATSPYLYKGGNLLVVVRILSAGETGRASTACRYTTAPNCHLIWDLSSTGTPTTNGVVSNNRPNIRIGFRNTTCAVTPISDFTFYPSSPALLDEGFDGDVFPPLYNGQPWTVKNNSVESSHVWAKNVTPYASVLATVDENNRYSAYLHYDLAKKMDSEIETPSIVIPSMPNAYYLSFYYMLNYSNNDVKGWEFKISEDDGTTWITEWETPKGNIAYNGNHFEEIVVDLEKYAGKTIKLKWRSYCTRATAATPVVLDFVRITPKTSQRTITINEGGVVYLINKSQGPPVTWKWTTTGAHVPESKGEHIALRYNTKGTYTVTLDIESNLGTSTATGTVNVLAHTPKANFDISGGMKQKSTDGLPRILAHTGVNIAFTDMTENIPTSWDWTFGGANPGSSTFKNPQVAYSAAGTYPLAFTVRNSEGPSTINSPEFAQIEGSANIWEIPFGDTGKTVVMEDGNYWAGTNNISEVVFVQKFTKPTAPVEISSIDIEFQVDFIKEGNTTDSIDIVIQSIAESEGLITFKDILGTARVAVKDIDKIGATKFAFKQPISINSSYFVILSPFASIDQQVDLRERYKIAIKTSKPIKGASSVYIYGRDLRFAEPVDYWRNFTDKHPTPANIALNISPRYTIAKLSIDGDMMNIKKPSKDDSNLNISVTSNVSWKATTTVNWITITSELGTGNGSFSVQCKDNLLGKNREAEIEIAAGGLKKQVLVQQAGSPPPNIIASIVKEGPNFVAALKWDSIPEPLTQDIFDNFEDHASFVLNSPGNIGWRSHDVDNSLSISLTKYTYTGRGSRMAYMSFNPYLTEPALTEEGNGIGERSKAYSGSQYLLFTAGAESGFQNNDWFVSPVLYFRSDFAFSFWARSLIDDYGKERFRVLYSTTGSNPADFTKVLTPGSYMELNATDPWTKFEYTIPKEARYVAINYVSMNSTFLMVDDVFIGTGLVPAPSRKTAMEEKDLAKPYLKGYIRKSVDLLQQENASTNANALERSQSVAAIAIKENSATLFKNSGLAPKLNNNEQIEPLAVVDKILKWGSFVPDAYISQGELTIKPVVVVRFTPYELQKYSGHKFTGVRFYSGSSGGVKPVSMTLMVWKGQQLVHTQDMLPALSEKVAGWIDVTLSTPINLDMTKDLIIGYQVEQVYAGQYQFFYSKGSPVAGYGDLMSINNGASWDKMSEVLPLALEMGNWPIGAILQGESDILFNIYRDGNKIATVTDLNYDDENLTFKANHCYEVTGVYVNGTLESHKSEKVCIDVLNPLNIRTSDITRMAGDPNPTLALIYEGFVNGDNESVLDEKPVVSTVAGVTSLPGIYDITITGGKDANYVINERIKGILTVIKRNLTVNADNKERGIGTDNPNFTVNYDGFVNGNDAVSELLNPILTTTASKFSPAGKYPIKVNLNGATSDFYELIAKDGELTITDLTESVPTAFIPQSSYAENAIFLQGTEIKVFSRNGLLIYEGKNGWDGRDKNGKVMGAGIYYYYAKQQDGKVVKGSVEVFVAK